MVVPTGIEPQTGREKKSEKSSASTDDYSENIQLGLVRDFPKKPSKIPAKKAQR
jgi:hypothetical protein